MKTVFISADCLVGEPCDTALALCKYKAKIQLQKPFRIVFIITIVK